MSPFDRYFRFDRRTSAASYTCCGPLGAESYVVSITHDEAPIPTRDPCVGRSEQVQLIAPCPDDHTFSVTSSAGRLCARSVRPVKHPLTSRESLHGTGF